MLFCCIVSYAYWESVYKPTYKQPVPTYFAWISPGDNKLMKFSSCHGWADAQILKKIQGESL